MGYGLWAMGWAIGLGLAGMGHDSKVSLGELTAHSPWPIAYPVINSFCGSRGVTSGPCSLQYMFTSLLTPNSPGR